jgi:hypothetical protein
MAALLKGLVLAGAIAIVGATGYGCSSAATPAPTSPAAQASQPAASAPATAAAVASASAPAPNASVPPPAAGDPVPVATKRYKCASLITDVEMQSSSGYAEAKLFSDDQSSELAGQTYCQFFTGDAGISIALSVFTAGPGWDKAFLPLWKLGQTIPGAVRLDGIGDGAIYGPTTHTGLALVAGHGISVVFSDLASGKLKGADLKAQVTKILSLVAGRV